MTYGNLTKTINSLQVQHAVSQDRLVLFVFRLNLSPFNHSILAKSMYIGSIAKRGMLLKQRMRKHKIPPVK